MNLLALVFALAIVAVPVEVTTTSGDTRRGEFVDLSAEGLQISEDGLEITIPTDQLSDLKVTEAQPKTGPKTQVTFAGGTRILAREVRLEGEILEVELPRQTLLRASVRSARAIRFGGAMAETDAAWLGILEKESRGDTLVIRRPGNRLDPTMGIIEGIAASKVQFSLDGDSVSAPIDRLEGVIFGASDDAGASPAIVVTDVYGSKWAIDEVALSDDSGSLKLKFGEFDHELPLSLLASIRWTSGLMMLADTEPVEVTIAPSLSTNVNANLINQLLGSETIDESDLVIQGGGLSEYRVEEGFRVLQGSVRRDERVKAASDLSVKILLDGEVAWEESLPDSGPRGFELEVGAAKRVTLQVDSGNDGDLGTAVKFIRPRLVK